MQRVTAIQGMLSAVVSTPDILYTTPSKTDQNKLLLKKISI